MVTVGGVNGRNKKIKKTSTYSALGLLVSNLQGSLKGNQACLSWTIFHSIPLPLNPIQISFHPSQTFHQCFRYFCHFQTLRHSSLVTSSPVTRHPSHRHTIIPSSLFFIVSFHHYRPSLFRISSAPLKFRASFSVMWLDDHHLTSLHSCGEQLLNCSSDLMTSFLVISYSWVQYPFISIFLYIRNSCASARLQFVID